MTRRSSSNAGVVIALACATLFGSGCALDVDMTTTPEHVQLGDAVHYELKVTNRSTCPVGDILLFVLPLLNEEQVSRLEGIFPGEVGGLVVG